MTTDHPTARPCVRREGCTTPTACDAEERCCDKAFAEMIFRHPEATPRPDEDMRVYPVIMNGDHAEFEREHANTPPKERPDWPLPSFDAKDWAEAFCKAAAKHDYKAADGMPIDAGWMTTWFANALMRGYDEHAARASGQKVDPARTDTPVTATNPMEGLPEGPYTLDTSGDTICIRAPDGGRLLTMNWLKGFHGTGGRRPESEVMALARAIAAIPAREAEIGRLRKSLTRLRSHVEKMREKAAAVVAASDDFREGMGPEWGGNELTDAADELRAFTETEERE